MIRKRTKRSGLTALVMVSVVLAGCGSSATPSSGGSSGSPAVAKPIVVGDLAYFTGPFGPNGPALAAEADFPIKEVINKNPPLGRTIEIIHEDIGTVGEGQAAKKLVDQDKVDIMLSPAHEYFTYRDYILDVVKGENRPLMPTVHGGVIPINVGGTASEPIFRAQGLDEGMGVTDILYVESIGAKSIAILATQTAGFQLMADASQKAAQELGIKVLDRIDTAETATSYRTEVERVLALKPDALLVLAPPAASGTFVKNIAEAGASTTVVLESGSSENEFYDTATSNAIATQKAVVFPGFAHQKNPAWDFFQALWDGNKLYADLNPAENMFPYTTYDLLIVTALAIEQAGTTKAADWAPAMYEVTQGGEVCYVYDDCITKIRAGVDIDYEGVTGSAEFSPTGVNAVTNAMFQWDPKTGTYNEIMRVDSKKHLEILAKVASRHE